MQVIYPGSFDPITYAHMDIIKRAKNIFGEVVVGVGKSKNKEYLFSIQERVELTKQALSEAKINKIEVVAIKGLLTDYIKKRKISVVIRGLRGMADFEYEFQMAFTNKEMSENLETIFILPRKKYFYYSSRIIKEAVYAGAKADLFLPPCVAKAVNKKIAGD
jgi:pantetheine-phosphate adenylyltransferase